MLARRIPLTNSLVQARHPLVLTLVAVAALACEEGTPTDTAREVPRVVAPRVAPGSDAVLAQGDTTPSSIQGTIPLPINQAFSSGGVAFRINQTGTGPNGNFTISNANSAATALHAQSTGSGIALRSVMTGTGRAAQFHTTSTSSSAPALDVLTNGLGPVAAFELNNPNFNQSTAVTVTTNSSGLVPALKVTNNGIGSAAYLEAHTDNVSGTALEVRQFGTGSAAAFRLSNVVGPASFRPALEVTSTAGPAAVFHSPFTVGGGIIEVTSNCLECSAAFMTVDNPLHAMPALLVSTNGGVGSWAGSFGNSGSGGGVQITTNGGPGLQVVGGTKNAVVRTPSGSRALYTEESTEVWFTDYGFERLASGKVRVRLDPKFSETVSLGEPYHVFLQPYGRAEIYVTNRNRSGFDVVLKDGEPNVEFSYRVVAKRLGFETKRLERAPWADRATLALGRR